MSDQRAFDLATAAAAEASRANFRQYLQYNRREFETLALDDARKFSTDLYAVTAELAPTRAEIAADVRKLGWRIPRTFADGRIGRGWPSQWLGHAYQKRRKKRGRGAGDANQRSRDLFMSKRPTLAQMQDFVIKERGDHRLYLASGWLGSIDVLGGRIKPGSGKVDPTRGSAIIHRGGPARISIEFWNRTPGIDVMQQKTDFLGRAVMRRIADRDVYIARKQKESADMLRRAA